MLAIEYRPSIDCQLQSQDPQLILTYMLVQEWPFGPANISEDQ